MAVSAWADPIVPGSGEQITEVGDDFEASLWQYNPQHPKSSRNLDGNERGPLGASANRRWLEGPHRGSPDIMQQVPTPPGGLPGSRQSLLIGTLNPGVPKKPGYEPQQDDVMLEVHRRLGHSILAQQQPNCVVRVYVPPSERWEQRSGASFGFRLDVWGKRPGERQLTQYWPGMFFNLRRTPQDPSAAQVFLTIRGDERGRDVRSIEVTPGWWTLGMSVTADGLCHFFARPGAKRGLRSEDHLATYRCYGYTCHHLDLVFFNVVTMDNGRRWSTPWIIDDPCVYSQPAVQLATTPGGGRISTRNRNARIGYDKSIPAVTPKSTVPHKQGRRHP